MEANEKQLDLFYTESNDSYMMSCITFADNIHSTANYVERWVQYSNKMFNIPLKKSQTQREVIHNQTYFSFQLKCFRMLGTFMLTKCRTFDKINVNRLSGSGLYRPVMIMQQQFKQFYINFGSRLSNSAMKM